LEILKDFFDLRLSYYDKRKEALKKKLLEELKKLTNQMKFILAVVNGELKVMKRKRKDVCRDMLKMGFDRIYPKLKKTDNQQDENKEQLEQEAGTDSLSQGYNYLLRMPIYSLTLEKVEEIKEKRADKHKELDILCKTPIQDIWLRDLDVFEKSLEEHEREKKEALEDDEKVKKKKKKTKGKKRRKGVLDNFSGNGGVSTESTDYATILDQLIITEDSKSSKRKGKKKKNCKITLGKTPNGDIPSVSVTPVSSIPNTLDSAPIAGFFNRQKSARSLTSKVKRTKGKKDNTADVVDFTSLSSSKPESSNPTPMKNTANFPRRSSCSNSADSDSDSDGQLTWAQRLAERMKVSSQQSSDSSSDDENLILSGMNITQKGANASKSSTNFSTFYKKSSSSSLIKKPLILDDDSSSEDVPLVRQKRGLASFERPLLKKKKLNNLQITKVVGSEEDSDDVFKPPNDSDYDASDDPFNF